MWRERSEARNSTSSATSSARPGRLPVSGISPAGYCAGTSAAAVSRFRVLAPISVSMAPGQTTFTRMPCLPSSTAAIWPRASCAALLQA